jgi:predicted aspartyl protease
MIHGFFGDEGALFFEIELINAEELKLPVDAMLDTGFSYWLAIDNQDLDGLDWVLLERQTMRTARGDFNFDIYAGKVRIDGSEFDIPVHVGEGLTEVLLGLKWLKTRRLMVDMPSGTLTLE